MSAIALFQSDKLSLSSRTNKAGYTTTGYVSKKEYGIVNKLKGAALSRAHLQYRIDIGMVGNVNISALLTAGQILAQKTTATADGFKVTFVNASALGAVPAEKPEVVAAKLSDEALLAIINGRKVAPAVPAQA